MLSCKSSGMMPRLGLTKGGGTLPGPGVVEGVGGCPADEAPLSAEAPDSSRNLFIPSAT